jgi:uncharacterized protein (TIGR02246 family)
MRLLTSCFLVLIGTMRGYAGPASAEQEILALEKQAQRAFLQRDVPALERLLSDDWRVIHVNGREQTKTQFIDAIKSGRARFLSIALDDVAVRFFGPDTAIVTSRWSNTIEFKGQQTSGQDRVTRVWVKQGGQWRIATDHATFLEPAAAAPRQDSAADEKEILHLENTLIHAWGANDISTLRDLLADEFQYWSFKGIRRNKADLLRQVEKSHTSGDTDLNTEVADPLVKVYGDTAIFTARIIDTGKHPDGLAFRSETCVTVLYVRRAGRWQIVADHETLLKPQ